MMSRKPRSALFLLGFLLLLSAACVPLDRFDPSARPGPAPATAATTSAPVRLAVLAPFSGPSAALGESALNAAQLALADLKAPHVTLLPFDTGAGPLAAGEAARSARAENVTALIGPVFAEDTRAAASALLDTPLPILSLSSDARVAGGNVHALGLAPEDQARFMARVAADQAFRRVAVLVSGDAFGRVMADSFVPEARARGVLVTQVIHLPAAPAALRAAIRSLSPTQDLPAPDAVFMPLPPATARAAADVLSEVGLPPARTRRLGTALWSDPALAGWPALSGALFAALPANARAGFETRYRAAYGEAPHPLAALAYDATALVITTTRENPSAPPTRAQFIRPNGFYGVDGAFRLTPDGRTERALALQAFDAGRIVTLTPAPQQF